MEGKGTQTPSVDRGMLIPHCEECVGWDIHWCSYLGKIQSASHKCNPIQNSDFFKELLFLNAFEVTKSTSRKKMHQIIVNYEALALKAVWCLCKTGRRQMWTRIKISEPYTYRNYIYYEGAPRIQWGKDGMLSRKHRKNWLTAWKSINQISV